MQTLPIFIPYTGGEGALVEVLLSVLILAFMFGAVILFIRYSDIKEAVQNYITTFKYNNTKVSCGCRGAVVRRRYKVGIVEHCGTPGCLRKVVATEGKTKDKLKWRV